MKALQNNLTQIELMDHSSLSEGFVRSQLQFE